VITPADNPRLRANARITTLISCGDDAVDGRVCYRSMEPGAVGSG
jgi:hypothetical protein